MLGGVNPLLPLFNRFFTNFYVFCNVLVGVLGLLYNWSNERRFNKSLSLQSDTHDMIGYYYNFYFMEY